MAELRRPVPAGMLIGLLLADIGAAIPFGLETGPQDNHVAVIEWVLSACFALAALALVARVIGFVPRYVGSNAVLLSAGAWLASALYAGFLLSGASARARLGFGFIFGGYAVAATFAYAVDRAQRHP